MLNTAMRQPVKFAACRLTFVMAFAFTVFASAAANAQPPQDDWAASRGTVQPRRSFDSNAQQTDDDPYMQLMQRIDPYSADAQRRDTSRVRTTTAANDAGDVVPGDSVQGSSRTLYRRSQIARALDNSTDPNEIIGSGFPQDVAGPTGAPTINTGDPLAMAAATVILRSEGLKAATEAGPSPFVAGQCLYYMGDVTILGLPSACR
jgi:hypothetical protein